MLKRVDVLDVEIGMFIHKLEGSWFKHPFWKSRFLLEDPAMLENLRASEVSGVIIDTSKGLDLRPQPQRTAPLPPLPADAARPVPRPAFTRRAAPARPRAPAVSAAQLRATAPQAMAQEFGLARTVAGQSRKIVSRIFLEARLGKGIKSSQVTPVIEDIFSSIQRNPHAFNGLMRCKRDNEYVYRHALAVSALMISLGRQMKLSPDEIREAGMAGLLIDVGIGHLPVDLTQYGGDYRNLPDEILHPHVKLGCDFLQMGGGIPQAVLDACLRHHEALDGSGYPHGLKADEIDTVSRMAAICDTFDSMVSDTADGIGMNHASAIQQMTYLTGWFDAEILQHFIDTMGIFPIGSLVLLRSNRLAMVVDQDPADVQRPRVRTFWSVPESRFVTPETIALATCYGADEIVCSADPQDYPIGPFAQLREKLFNAGAKAG